MKVNLIRILLIIVSGWLLLAGCNPVKKVLKSQQRTDEVVTTYLRANPPKNDTIFQPGKLVIKDTTIFDSVAIPYAVNHRYTETRIIQEKIRDTVTIVDRSFTEALTRRLTKLETDMVVLKQDRDDWQATAQQRFWALLITWIAILVFITFKVYKYLQPRITIKSGP